MPLSLSELVERWMAVALTERAAAQSHFIDVCPIWGSAQPQLFFAEPFCTRTFNRGLLSLA